MNKLKIRNPKSQIPNPKSEAGQSLVESVLVFTLLMVIVLGLLDFAYVFQAYVGVVNAAGVGAMYGATSQSAAYDQTGIHNAALAESNSWHCASPTVTSSVSTDSYGFRKVSVTVRCQVADLIAIPNSFNQIFVSSTAVRRVRQ
jgi:Flp pilus assembly protein TadG